MTDKEREASDLGEKLLDKKGELPLDIAKEKDDSSACKQDDSCCGEISKDRETASTAEEKIDEEKKNEKKRIRRLITSIVIFVVLIVGISLIYNVISLALFIGAVSVIILAECFAVWGVAKKIDSFYKIASVILYVALILVYGVMILEKTGVLKQFDTTEKFVSFVRNTGGIAELVFLLVQIAQVTLIPIPSTITTVGSQVLFGGFWIPFLLSTSGLIIGSMIAFWLGRVFGIRLAKWMVGKDVLDKYQKIVKGKDKLVLFYMFLFPFFPDDFLCLLAGMTNMKYISFFFMMLFTRSVGTAVTLLMSMGLFSIPFSGWGIAVWIVVILISVVLLYFTIRYSEKIEAAMLKLIGKFTDKFRFGKKASAPVSVMEAAKENENLKQDEVTPVNGDESRAIGNTAKPKEENEKKEE